MDVPRSHDGGLVLLQQRTTASTDGQRNRRANGRAEYSTAFRSARWRTASK
jgi:hypothetical protein